MNRIDPIMGSWDFDKPAQEVCESARLSRLLDERNRLLSNVSEFFNDVFNARTTEAVVRIAISQIYFLFEADAVVLALHDPVTDELTVVEQRATDCPSRPGTRIAPGQGLIGKCFQSRRYLFEIKPVDNKPTGLSPVLGGGRIMRAAPLLSHGTCRGVLAASWGGREGDFDLADKTVFLAAATSITSALENCELRADIERRLNNLSVVRKTALAIASTLDPDEVFRQLLRSIHETLESDIASVMLLDQNTRTLSIVASEGLPEDVVASTRVKVGESISGFVAREGVPLLVDDVEQDMRFYRRNNPRYGSRVALSVPLKSQGGVLGVINVNSSNAGRRYTKHDLDLLSILSQHAASAIFNARLHAEVLRLATTDDLTGLRNRRAFFEAVEEEICRAERYELTFSLLVLDVDHFKSVNDTFGHTTGDEVLRAVAATLRQQCREVDRIGRYGGEEFAVLLPETGAAAANGCADRLRKAIAELVRVPGDTERHITVSVGGAVYPEHGTTMADLVRAADDALYQAKNSGRNTSYMAAA